MAVRDLLDRFRPAGTPGAAAPSGVPVDRNRQREDELMPVLVLLAETEQESDAVRRSGRDRAEHARSEANAVAASTVATARDQAEAARAEAAARQHRINEARAADEMKAAHRRAGEIASTASERSPAVVDAAVQAVRAALLSPLGARSTTTGGSS